MPRFFGPVVLSIFSLLAQSFMTQNLAAQTVTTSVTALPATGAFGTQTSIAAAVAPATTPFLNPAGAVVLPTGTVQFLDGTTPLAAPAALTPGSGFTTTPFSTVFGTIDPAFINVSGQLAGDLNGDGVEDLVLYGNASSASLPQSNVEVQSFVSNAKGGYSVAAATSLAVPSAPISSAPVLADVNGDGKLDLLIGSSVCYGNGDGTFAQPVALAFLASGYSQTYAADVTGDGKTDIIALNTVATGGTNGPYTLLVTVFANQGSGSYQSLGTFPIGSGQAVEQALLASLTFVDLNGDGKLDMVPQMYFIPAGNAAEPATLTSVLNRGDGTFAAPVPVTYTVQQNGGSIELLTVQAADFNKDGKTDLALVYPAGLTIVAPYVNPIVFLAGNGDGTFGGEIDSVITTPGTYNGTGQQLGNAIVTDANLDGAPDIAFGNGTVAAGDGAGHFRMGTPVVAQSSGSVDSVAGVVPVLMVGSSYPSLVFAAVPSAAVAPFPLVAAHNLASTASLAAMTLGVGTHSITGQYSGDANYAASTSAPSVVTVGLANPTITATSSANPAYVTQAVSFAVTVATVGSVPTGTVVLSNGSTQLGAGTLDATGKTTIAATFATAGSASLTAAYSGDTTHTAATTTISQGVVPAFTVAAGGGSATITVPSGQSASAQLSLTGGAAFAGSVTLTCSGLPSTAVCTFNPATLNLSGSTAQSTTLTVSTGGSTTAGMVDPFRGAGMTLTCGLFAGGLMLLWPRRRRNYWPMCLIAGIALLSVGCGGNSSPSTSKNNTPAGTYAFKVVATAGTIQTDTDYTLTVQ